MNRTSIAALALLACGLAAPAAAQTMPVPFAGAMHDRLTGWQAAGEVWVFRSRERQAVPIIAAALNPDGTAKLGGGIALAAGDALDTFFFADVRGWIDAETTAGGRSGQGAEAGLGMAIGRVLVRGAVGYGDVADRRGRYWSGGVLLRLWP